MLKPKMEKNGLHPSETAALFKGDNLLFKTIPKYNEGDVQKAIALAYRSGYTRASKGRPFKFNTMKDLGHWEPIISSSELKEGTKIRCVIEYPNFSLLRIGDIGEIAYNSYTNNLAARFLNKANGKSYIWITGPEVYKYLEKWVEE